MSKNRNRARYDKAISQRELNILFKKDIYSYCPTCTKRNGNWFWDCHPANLRAKDRHPNGRVITSRKLRSYKTWKQKRKTQWKEKGTN